MATLGTPPPLKVAKSLRGRKFERIQTMPTNVNVQQSVLRSTDDGFCKPLRSANLRKSDVDQYLKIRSLMVVPEGRTR